MDKKCYCCCIALCKNQKCYYVFKERYLEGRMCCNCNRFSKNVRFLISNLIPIGR